MGREVEFGNISTLFEKIEYPIERAAAVVEFSGVTLLLADGEVDLDELISETTSETFESPSDIETALHNVLPREAVGEPYQSEGDA